RRENGVTVFRLPGAIVASSLAFLAMVATPSGAQQAPASGPAEPSPSAVQAPAEPGPAEPLPSAGQPPAAAKPPVKAERPESTFADLFAQLAGRLVGVVVNISTQAAPPAAKATP